MNPRPMKLRAYVESANKIMDVCDIAWDTQGNISYVSVWWSYEAGRQNVPLTGIKLMESTGLFDKNKREMWEGDIIRFEKYHGFKNYPIKWGENCDCCDKVYGFVIPGGSMGFYEEDYEVVGNIYQNPELLNA